MLLQNNCLNNVVTNGLKEEKEKKACKTGLHGKTRKATGFKSLRVNCWEINQVTSKCQQISEIKLVEKGVKVSTTIEFYIFEIVKAPYFSLKLTFCIFELN